MDSCFFLKSYVSSVYDIIPRSTPTKVTTQDGGQRAFWAFPCVLKVRRAGRYRDLKNKYDVGALLYRILDAYNVLTRIIGGLCVPTPAIAFKSMYRRSALPIRWEYHALW